MKVRVFLLSFLCSLLIVIAISNSLPTHSQGKTASVGKALSKEEQDLFNEINQARANPELYVSYLQKMKPLFAGKIYKKTLETQEGWAAVEDAIAYLQTLKPQSPFTMSLGLNKAAAAHIKDQSSSGATGHKTAGSGWMIEDRVKPFGTWEGSIGENLTYGRESARERVLTWLIDDGFTTRGHRKRVMSADYGVAGLSCGKHPEYEKMCCLTLAGGFIDSVTPTPSTNSGKKSGTPLKRQSPAPTPRKMD
ncbi:MAG TPA: CAP domain-containing protein [Pyrinomonadaceae bacterium]|nr:CAP domain-containing protein [Pyrinomonadaceae bacterium]